MSFWRYIFSFLYVRDWNTGENELSRTRLVILASAIFLIILALVFIAILQTPIAYSK
jgi:hypothetical protein